MLASKYKQYWESMNRDCGRLLECVVAFAAGYLLALVIFFLWIGVIFGFTDDALRGLLIPLPFCALHLIYFVRWLNSNP